MFGKVTTLFIAFWLLAAHFLRDGHIAISVSIAFFPCLIFTKNIIAVRTLQIGLVLAVLAVWLPSTFTMVEYRIVTERPWIRLSSIMGAVMILNFIAAWCISGLVKLPTMSK